MLILDWECVRWDLPQYDIAQFLLYTSTPATIVERCAHYLEYCRHFMQNISGLPLDKREWLLGFKAAVKAHLIDRAPLMGLIFILYPGAKINIGVLMYQNAQALIRAWGE